MYKDTYHFLERYIYNTSEDSHLLQLVRHLILYMHLLLREPALYVQPIGWTVDYKTFTLGHN